MNTSDILMENFRSRESRCRHFDIPLINKKPNPDSLIFGNSRKLILKSLITAGNFAGNPGEIGI